LKDDNTIRKSMLKLVRMVGYKNSKTTKIEMIHFCSHGLILHIAASLFLEKPRDTCGSMALVC